MRRARRDEWPLGQRLKNDALYAASAATIAMALALPRCWLPWLGTLLGRICYSLLPGARRTTLANLALVHPGKGARSVREEAIAIFQTLGRNLADAVALLDPGEAPGRTLRLPEESHDELRRALAEGRGVVYVTCHLGPWERMAALLAHHGFPITTVARESYDARFHGLLYDKLRTNRNVKAIYRDAPGAPFAMLRALRRGRVLGLLVDLPSRLPTRSVNLLGQPARLPLGPARLALRARCPVVVGTPRPGPGGSLEVQIARLATADLGTAERDEAELTQRMADAVGERILALPRHWPWMHDSFDSSTCPAIPLNGRPPLNSLDRFA